MKIRGGTKRQFHIYHQRTHFLEEAVTQEAFEKEREITLHEGKGCGLYHGGDDVARYFHAHALSLIFSDAPRHACPTLPDQVEETGNTWGGSLPKTQVQQNKNLLQLLYTKGH